MSQISQFTGLLDAHKTVLKEFFSSYLATEDRKERRKIAQRAAERVATDFGITSSEDRNKLLTVIFHF